MLGVDENVRGDWMKREATILNLVCVLAALGFVGLAALNALSAGSFLSVDGLFLTVVWLLLALVFLSVPAHEARARGLLRLRNPFKHRLQPALSPSGSSLPALSSVSPSSAPRLTDARGRSLPPDVNRIVAEMRAQRSTEG